MLAPLVESGPFGLAGGVVQEGVGYSSSARWAVVVRKVHEVPRVAVVDIGDCLFGACSGDYRRPNDVPLILCLIQMI